MARTRSHSRKRSHHKRHHRTHRRRRLGYQSRTARGLEGYEAYGMNPRHRRRRRHGSHHRRSHHRRRYHHNPPSVTTGFSKELGFTAAGFLGTKVISAFALPLLGAMGANNFVRLGGQVVVATALGYGFRMIDKEAFVPVLVGGGLQVINEVIKDFLAPMIPALAAYEMGIDENEYRQAMGEYPAQQVALGDYPTPQIPVLVPGGETAEMHHG